MELQPDKVITQKEPTSGLSKIINLLDKVINPLSGKMGRIISCTAIACMMFLTFFDVAGRFILNKPISGSFEITQFCMAIMVAFGLGYSALYKVHIRVDLLMQYTSRKVNLWLNVFAYGTAWIFYVFLTWQIWQDARQAMASKITSSVLIIPIYPFVFLLSIGAALLVLVFFRDFLQSIREANK